MAIYESQLPAIYERARHDGIAERIVTETYEKYYETIQDGAHPDHAALGYIVEYCTWATLFPHGSLFRGCNPTWQDLTKAEYKVQDLKHSNKDLKHHNEELKHHNEELKRNNESLSKKDQNMADLIDLLKRNEDTPAWAYALIEAVKKQGTTRGREGAVVIHDGDSMIPQIQVEKKLAEQQSAADGEKLHLQEKINQLSREIERLQASHASQLRQLQAENSMLNNLLNHANLSREVQKDNHRKRMNEMNERLMRIGSAVASDPAATSSIPPVSLTSLVTVFNPGSSVVAPASPPVKREFSQSPPAANANKRPRHE
ncbi:hypothetical protein EG329_001377 [Mollisiaceae sp. DMI_Dod_QoI]|nr:hypothetical protein EG329_001377 [Helotiales sp. DMI_Dod_QoI]